MFNSSVKPYLIRSIWRWLQQWALQCFLRCRDTLLFCLYLLNCMGPVRSSHFQCQFPKPLQDACRPWWVGFYQNHLIMVTLAISYTLVKVFILWGNPLWLWQLFGKSATHEGGCAPIYRSLWQSFPYQGLLQILVFKCEVGDLETKKHYHIHVLHI